MHPDVVRMRVELAVVGIRDDDLRTLGPDEGHESTDRLVERRVGEVVGPFVHVGVGHAGVVVAEHLDDVVADRRGAVGELLHADVVEIVPDVRRVDRGIQDLAGFATGATDEHGSDAFVVVPSDRRASLRRLVVRVRVHGQHAERVAVTIDRCRV